MAFSNAKHNLTATAAPTTGDDVADQYEPGSIWLDTTNDRAYICRDNTASAAVWIELRSITVSTGSPTGGQNGDIWFKYT